MIIFYIFLMQHIVYFIHNKQNSYAYFALKKNVKRSRFNEEIIAWKNNL